MMIDDDLTRIMFLTFVIVNLVITSLLQSDVAARSVPATLTQTLPALLVVWHGARPVTIAVARTPLQSAVFTIPTIGAETSAIAAHPMLRTPGITGLHRTAASLPALVTHAVSSSTVTMITTLQVTQLRATRLTHEAGLTLTLTTLHVPGAVTTTVWETPPLLIIHLVTGLTSPTLATHT